MTRKKKPILPTCPQCGRPYDPGLGQVVECPGCGKHGSTECCCPGGVGCLCPECEEKDERDERTDA